jgi:hypothetical protein
MEVVTILAAEVLALELRTHRGDLCGGEMESLEVGETPPHLAELRRQLDAT